VPVDEDNAPAALVRLVALLRQGNASREDVNALVDSSSELIRVSSVHYRCREYEVHVAVARGIERMLHSLRQIESLGLSCAPVVVGSHETPDGLGILVQRYAACAGERLLPVVESLGPYPHAAKARILEELRRLRAAGLWHSYAHLGLDYWMRAERSGTLVLSDWSALSPWSPSREVDEVQEVEDMLHRLPLFAGTAGAARVLAGQYTSFLQRPEDETHLALLVSALYEAGRTLESELLRRYLDGVDCAVVQEGEWVGGQAHIGAFPPPAASPGELWMDTVELSATIWVGTCWMSIQPVARWQLRAWSAHVQSPEVDRRWLEGTELDPPDDRSPVTCITPTEAEAYCHWLGKALPSRHDWLSAQGHLSRTQFEDLWALGNADWLADRLSQHPNIRVHLSQSRLWDEPEQILLRPQRHQHGLAQPDTRDLRVGFRTASSSQTRTSDPSALERGKFQRRL
jgi:hypothetical protein